MFIHCAALKRWGVILDELVDAIVDGGLIDVVSHMEAVVVGLEPTNTSDLERIIARVQALPALTLVVSPASKRLHEVTTLTRLHTFALAH